jgi:hypothetical protein
MGNNKGCNLANRKRPYEALFNKLAYTCQRDGKDFSLTYDQFFEFTENPYCAYCGSPVEWTRHHLHGHSHRYNLDRKYNLAGYHKDNCVVCCWNCNQIKGSLLTYEEMKVAMAAVAAYRNCVRASSYGSNVVPAHAFGDGSRENTGFHVRH